MKVIVLHDSLRHENHADLYAQLLAHFKCEVSDTSTSDLGRGNYLSYDPDLWINPSPTPFHYEPSPVPPTSTIKTQTVVTDNTGNYTLQNDESNITQFLRYLEKTVLTDESIINILRKTWNQSTISRGRNNTAFSYAGILCKAGVKKETAIAFIHELIPDLPENEIRHATVDAYDKNIFGSKRRNYIKKRR